MIMKVREGEKVAFISRNKRPREIIPPRNCMDDKGRLKTERRHASSEEETRKAKLYSKRTIHTTLRPF